MGELSFEMIREILKKHLKHIQRVNESAAIFDSGMMTDGQFEEKRNSVRSGKEYFNRLLQKREDDVVIKEILDGFLQELGIEIDKESNQYKILKHGLVLNYNKLYENEEKKVNGEISIEALEDAMNEYILKVRNDSNEKSVIKSQGKTNKSKHSLTCIWEKFQKEKIEVEHKREASFNEFRSIFNFFIEFSGDVPVDEINGAVIRDYRQLLLKLPKNRIKHKEYKNKSIKEFQEIEIPEEERISLTTVNKYLGVLQSYFNYAVREAFIERNPVVPGMIRQVGGNEIKKDVRPFKNDELNKIFSSSVYEKDDDNNFAYRYWIPLIALFTGARSNEICQLYLDDIREVENVWVFDINNNMPDKQIKNEASRRLIPIHPFLLTELKLLKYVNKLRRSRNTRLFPELKLSSSNKYNAALVNWFMRLKNGLRLDNGSVNFHSFRKTYANFCKQNKVRLNLDEHMYKRIIGHALNDMTAEVYGNEFSPQLLYENIMVKINFDDVDFSHVLRSQFIIR